MKELGDPAIVEKSGTHWYLASHRALVGKSRAGLISRPAKGAP